MVHVGEQAFKHFKGQHDAAVAARVFPHGREERQVCPFGGEIRFTCFDHMAEAHGDIRKLVLRQPDHMLADNGRCGLAKRAGLHFLAELRNHTTLHPRVRADAAAADAAGLGNRRVRHLKPVGVRDARGPAQDIGVVKFGHFQAKLVIQRFRPYVRWETLIAKKLFSFAADILRLP